jgi:hypothetical protein
MNTTLVKWQRYVIREDCGYPGMWLILDTVIAGDEYSDEDPCPYRQFDILAEIEFVANCLNNGKHRELAEWHVKQSWLKYEEALREGGDQEIAVAIRRLKRCLRSLMHHLKGYTKQKRYIVVRDIDVMRLDGGYTAVEDFTDE